MAKRVVKLPRDALERLQGTMAVLEEEFSPLRPHLQELAQYLLPRRYVWLAEQSPIKSVGLGSTQKSQNASRLSKSRNDRILDPTGTRALRVLAAGLLNGITSPTRPWLRLRPVGFKGQFDEQPVEHVRYFDEVARRMLLVMAESNFYATLAILYLDLSAFGTAAALIYEDYDEVIRCYNSPVGEFRLGQDSRRMVDTYGRTFHWTLRQALERFGEETLDPKHKGDIAKGGQALGKSITICHLIEPNLGGRPESISSKFKYREMYWEKGRSDGTLLEQSGYYEKPGMFPRWELTGNDTYGTSPGMDALPEIIQLQHETLRKAQALDKLISPPIVAETFMRNRNTSLLPGGITYAPTGASFGAKPVYTVQPPLGEMSQDLMNIQLRIREIFHNDLFRMISNLDTVRTATEIDARKEEKLVLLGAVLERFENEALDPAVRRIFNIMQRKELLPEQPESLNDVPIEIEYVSVLSDAQRAVGTATIERFLQVLGNLVPVFPELKATANPDELMRDYAERLNVPGKGIRPREESQELIAGEQELVAQQQAALTGETLTSAAKQLSETDVGGGENAIQRLLG